MIRFVVHGRAAPAGALKVGINSKTGRAHLHHRDPAPLRDFKNGIRYEAAQALGGDPPWTDPAAVDATFYFLRPQAHFGTGRNAGVLKTNAPEFPSNRAQGDIDKLARSLLDALTGILIADDSQVAKLHLAKRWADQGGERVEITAWPLTAQGRLEAALEQLSANGFELVDDPTDLHTLTTKEA